MLAQDSPSRKQDQYIVRFPDGMRDRLKDAAAENGRSLNAEIVHRLESTFIPADSELPEGEIAELARQFTAYRREQRELYDELRAAGIIKGKRPTAKEWVGLEAARRPPSSPSSD